MISISSIPFQLTSRSHIIIIIIIVVIIIIIIIIIVRMCFLFAELHKSFFIESAKKAYFWNVLVIVHVIIRTVHRIHIVYIVIACVKYDIVMSVVCVVYKCKVAF